MAKFLDKITDIVLVDLNQFIQKVTEDNDSNNETRVELYVQELDDLLKITVRNLSLSLLNGEYVTVNTLRENCSKLKENLNKSPEITGAFNGSLQNKILEYSIGIGFLLDSYSFFINEISNYFSEDKKNFAFSKKSRMSRISKSILTSSSEDALDYFLILIWLHQIDHFPSNTNEYISSIFELENDLLEVNILEFADITENVKSKINFLKHKWKKRKFDENPDLIQYRIDGEIRIVEDYIGDNIQLQNWIDIIETQYELTSNNWKNELKNRVKPYKNLPTDNLTLLQIHQLIKFSKDVKKDALSLNRYCEELKLRLNNSIEESYDKYVLGISYNYSLNNQFSLFLEDQPNYDLVRKEYLNIKSKIQGNVNNFFLSFKYLEYLGQYFLRKILEEEKIDFVNKYESIVKELWSEVEEYFEQKEWSKIHSNYVFILPYKESLVSTTGLSDVDNIFYASSFVLPPSNKGIEKNYTKIREYFEEIRLYINTGKHFKKEIDKIKNLNDELDKKDFKSIEIISIFTAIITFVLSSIPSYRFVESVQESVLFMLSLASSLSLFIILILFTTRNLYKKWQAYAVLVFLFLIGIFGYIYLFEQEKYSKREKVSIKEEVKIIIDSLQKHKLNNTK